MLNAEKCYRLTLVRHTSTSTPGNTPVQAIVQNIRKDFDCTTQISYEQAALLMVKVLHEPPVIREYMDALLNDELVELRTEGDEPCLFSAHELSEVGIPIDFKRTS
jgi:hypothetical protein